MNRSWLIDSRTALDGAFMASDTPVMAKEDADPLQALENLTLKELRTIHRELNRLFN